MAISSPACHSGGQNFELLPFGAGRRICPGIPMAHRVLHHVVASLLHCFDWEVGSGSTPQTIDMKEGMGNNRSKAYTIKSNTEEDQQRMIIFRYENSETVE
ncbi:hypothetical protein JCGZ_22835 [Jatropha curcas]|uniref:Cytochrome P450 n=1 Tax=Jatropha curcas TaxID=180498 RepID=A0A067K2Z2_JATCU|nr:hypothetical protein JCGZ_22835 [Jatropha curcas]